MVVVLILGLRGAGCRTVANYLATNLKFSLTSIQQCNADELRSNLTRDHTHHHVVLGVTRIEDMTALRSRSFVVSIAIDAPLTERCLRLDKSMEELVLEDEATLYGQNSLARCLAAADIRIYNTGTLEDLLETVSKLNADSTSIFRPNFDELFMNCAKVISSRSNCLRRAVGAVLTSQDCVVMSTGYNGTPTKTTDCLDGGCLRCADITQTRAVGLSSCLCVHAEANALLQAGMARSQGGTLYVTCCPCLSCAKLIIQGRIKRLVYADEYNRDPVVLRLLNEGHVTVIRHVDRQMKRYV